jgi:glycine/D-amino acid oxidase-like deaminating enzyme
MVKQSAPLVICGAGIAGISAAYHMAVVHGMRDVVLVDERPPLSLTSDKSTECYRNWWPGPGDAMVALMNRSIDILESLARQSGNAFHLNRRGYLFATAEEGRISDFRQAGEEAEALGAGPLRMHSGNPHDPPYQPAPAEGFEEQPTGADLITDQRLIRQHFPYLTPKTIAVIHARRCGWFSAQQLGALMLQRAREHGVRVLQAHVQEVAVARGRVQGVRLAAGEGPSFIATGRFVAAPGPLLKEMGMILGVELPVFCELHFKVAFNDQQGVIPRHAPLVIWTDAQRLPWNNEERAFLNSDPATHYLLQEFPAGVHTRPEGPGDSPVVLILWTYRLDPVKPVFPPPLDDPIYPEVALRGLATAIPGLQCYLQRMPKLRVDGGYYTKTTENRPFIGPLPIEGAYVLGALSGFGLMASPAAGELLAAHITGAHLPPYAGWFALQRYKDPSYQELLRTWESTGQL